MKLSIRILIILILFLNQTVDAETQIIGKFKTDYDRGSVMISGDGNIILYDEFNGGEFGKEYGYNITAINKTGEKKWLYRTSSKYSQMSNLYAIHSRNIDASFDGNFIIFGFNSELFVLDGKGKLRWKYKSENDNDNSKNFNSVAISSDGRYVAALYYNNNQGILYEGGKAYLFDNSGKILWNKSIVSEYLVHISISSAGDYISVSTLEKSNPGEATRSKLYLFDSFGNLIKIFQDKDFYGSSIYQKNVDGGIIINTFKRIAYFDYDFNKKWKISRLYLFNWDDVPGKDENKIIEYLSQDLGANWAKDANIEKLDNGNQINISTDRFYAIFYLKNETLFISDGSSYEFDRKTENGKINIYKTFKHQYESVGVSNSGKIVVAQEDPEGGQEGKVVFFDDGIFTEKFEINDGLQSISNSADGQYIAARSRNWIYLLNYSDPLHINTLTATLISPKDGEALANQTPVFDWKDVTGASGYLIRIDGEIFKTNNSQFIIQKNLSLGKHQWEVRAILDSNNTSWTQPRTFTIVSSEGITVKRTMEERIADPRILIGGAILFVVFLGLVARPFYKRWILKKKLEKTSTDWCPHCHKFTGGAETCPHCGLKTLIGKNYLKEKNIKTKKV